MAHAPKPDSAEEGYPAGRTICGRLLGYRFGLLHYKNCHKVSEIKGLVVCSGCFPGRRTEP
eukprot:1333085-Karenia_brevis.AAC.1